MAVLAIASHNVVFNHQLAAQQQTSYAPSPAYGQQSGGPPYGQGLPQSAYVWPQGSMPPPMGQPPQVRGVLLLRGGCAHGCCRRYDLDARGGLLHWSGRLPMGCAAAVGEGLGGGGGGSRGVGLF
jgi:hypothetical protein